VPQGVRYYPNTAALDSLTACSAANEVSGNYSGNAERWQALSSLPMAEATWVDNQFGAK